VNTHHCCEPVARQAIRETIGTPIAYGDRPITFARRCSDIAGWIIPGATLALLPKCPVCVASYIVIGTGVGLSVSAVTFLRTLVVTLCVALLCYHVAKSALRFVALIFKTKRNGVPGVRVRPVSDLPARE
jgi:hypothetical protein